MSRLKFLSVALVLAPVSGHAYDWSTGFAPDTTRYFSDPSFIPSEGQLTSGTTYGFHQISEDAFNSTIKAANVKVNLNTVEQGFSYGITDRLSVNTSMSFEEEREKDTYSGFGENKFYSNGFTNPSFGVTYRAIDQTSYPISIDITAGYVPDLLPARIASSEQAGTVASGGQSAGAGIAASWETKSFTALTSVSATYFGAERATLVSNDSFETFGTHYEYSWALKTQTRLSDIFSVDAGLVLSEETDYRQSTAQFTGTMEHGLTTDPYVALNTFIVPNRFYVSLEYDHDWFGDEKREDVQGTVPALWKNHSENQYFVRIRGLFF